MSRFALPSARRTTAALSTLGVLVWLALAPPEHAAAGDPAPEPALGVHAMLYLDAPASFKRAMLREAAAMGASLVRADVPLALIRPTNGIPDYAAFDEDLRLARAQGIGLLGLIGATPSWAGRCPPGTPFHETIRCPYADLDLFREHVRDLARRGRGVVQAWEVLNEPEGVGLLGSAEEYAAILDAAIDGIRAGDPQAKVVMGGSPFHPISLAFVTRVMQAPGFAFGSRIDVANVHIRGPLHTLAGQVRRFRAHLLALGLDKPLWVTEFGYPSRYVDQLDGIFGSWPEVQRVGRGEKGQATYLRRGIPTLLAGGAEKVFVALREGSGGMFQTEGVLRGAGVRDPPGADPRVVRKRGFRAVRYLVRTGKLQPAAIARAR
ncbi:MAG: hypothetical protein JWO90_1123, partial [Solirubrobacterales bacterium]|nr:hypothetical protein [Solirubrobacterales bacterium]